jgi:hypothetical protein
MSLKIQRFSLKKDLIMVNIGQIQLDFLRKEKSLARNFEFC